LRDIVGESIDLRRYADPGRRVENLFGDFDESVE
jgi:hypothetical protein